MFVKESGALSGLTNVHNIYATACLTHNYAKTLSAISRRYLLHDVTCMSSGHSQLVRAPHTYMLIHHSWNFAGVSPLSSTDEGTMLPNAPHVSHTGQACGGIHTGPCMQRADGVAVMCFARDPPLPHSKSVSPPLHCIVIAAYSVWRRSKQRSKASLC